MPVIALINQKGGCGKSTTSCHLAYWLRQQGYSVVVVDSDAQQAVTRWLASMKLDPPIETMVISQPDDVMEKIPKLASNYDYVVVDGAAGITEVTRCILLRADLAIVPVKPTGLDLDSAKDAIRSVEQAQSVRGGLPKVKILLTQAVKNTILYDDALKYMADKPSLKAVIHHRQAIADCFTQAAVAWTLPVNKLTKEAVADFDRLCTEIMEVLTNG